MKFNYSSTYHYIHPFIEALDEKLHQASEWMSEGASESKVNLHFIKGEKSVVYKSPLFEVKNKINEKFVHTTKNLLNKLN